MTYPTAFLSDIILVLHIQFSRTLDANFQFSVLLWSRRGVDNILECDWVVLLRLWLLEPSCETTACIIQFPHTRRHRAVLPPFS